MIAIAEFEGPAGYRLSGHGHDAWHACIVTAGGFAQELGGRVADCPAGTIRLSPPGAAHDIAFSSAGARCTIVEFSGAFWGRIARRLAGDSGASRFGRVSGDEAFAETPMGLAALLARTLGETRSPAWLEEVRAALEHGPPCAIAGIARHNDRHRGHLSRAFRTHFGMTPAEFRTLARVERAGAMLRESRASLAEIAAECGFSHQSHMTNAMRLILGRTPGDVRAAA